MKYRFIQMLWTSSLAWNATSQRIASSTVPCKSPIVCQGEESTSSKKQSVVDLQKRLLMKKMQMMDRDGNGSNGIEERETERRHSAFKV